MKGIIGGLLEYARAPRTSDRIITPTGKPEPLPSTVPATLLRHVGALLEPQLKKARARLVTDIGSDAPLAIEANQLQQVLVNLVQNSTQAMTDGGTITIAVKRAPGGVATLITVSDDGPGIPAKDRGRVFDPMSVAVTRSINVVGTAEGRAKALETRLAARRRMDRLAQRPDGQNQASIMSYSDTIEAAEAGALYGTPDEIATKLQALRDVGAEYVLLNSAGGPASLRRFAHEVRPAFAGSR